MSFGTIVWRYYAREALRALTTLARAFEGAGDIQAVVSLGGTSLAPGDRAAIERPNVAVHSYVDQWRVLQEADVFVTHQGLNSTHEAIAHGVPMVSHPFFWDQPALAERCRRFGLSVPLAGGPRQPFEPREALDAVGRVAAERPAMAAALARAREWERRVIRRRPGVLNRLLRTGVARCDG